MDLQWSNNSVSQVDLLMARNSPFVFWRHFVRYLFGSRVRYLAFAILACWGSASARASLVLSINSMTNSSSISYLGNTPSDALGNQALGINDSGGTTLGIGAVDAVTRYASMAAADNPFNSVADRTTVNSDYTVVFRVIANSGWQYNVDISTLISGALTQVSDGNQAASTSISNVSGFYNSNPEALLSLAVANSTSTNSSTNVPISGSNNLNITGLVGTGSAQDYTVRFTFTTFANSNASSVIQTGGDEAAVRLGGNDALTATIPIIGGQATTADDYPGVGGRTQANDGHFVTFRASVIAVPEPSSALLAISGLVSLACYRRRIA